MHPTRSRHFFTSIVTSDRPFSHRLGSRMPTALIRVMPGATPATICYPSEFIDRFEVIGNSPTEIPSGTQTTLRETLGSDNAIQDLPPVRRDRTAAPPPAPPLPDPNQDS